MARKQGTHANVSQVSAHAPSYKLFSSSSFSGRLLLAGTTALALFGLPRMGRAEEPGKPKLMAKAEQTSAIGASIPRVPLSRLQELDVKTEPYRKAGGGDLETAHGFSTVVKVPIPGDPRWSLVALAQIGIVNGRYVKQLTLATKPPLEYKGPVGPDGSIGFVIDLTPLANAYTQTTDKQMGAVKLLVDTFQSKNPQLGTGIVVHTVPIEHLGAPIEANVPLIFNVYYTGTNQVTEEKPKLIAMN